MDKPETQTLSPGEMLPFERQDAPSDEELYEGLLAAMDSDDESEQPDASEPEPESEGEVDEIEPETAGEPEGDDPEGESESVEDEAEDEEESDGSLVFEWEEDGETRQMTLEELRAGQLRQEDYTRKTQEAAEIRKAAEAEKASLRQAREEYAANLQHLRAALEEMTPEEPDWGQLRRELPSDEFAARWAEFQQAQTDLQKVKNEQRRVQEERLADWNEQLNAQREIEQQRLLEAIPEWQDEEVQAEESRELVQYATTTYGWTPEQIGQVMDHRLIVMLQKAMLYDKAQQKGTKALKEKVKGKKVLRPGARGEKKARSKKSKKAAQRRDLVKLARSGNEQKAVAALVDILPDDF